MHLPQKLSVIIPAYNKDSEIFKVVSKLVTELKKTAYDWEIVVVDDASRDQTLREAVRSKKFNGNTHRIKICTYNINIGKGFALYHGFKKSTGDIIAFLDSDLDLPVSNLKTLLNIQSIQSADIVIGSKRHPESKVNYPFERRVQSKIYQLLVRALFNLHVTDTQVGVKVFRRQVLEEAFPRIVIKRFAFDLELLVVAKDLGFNKIIEAPITLNYNFTSSITVKAVKEILVDTLAVFYRKNFLHYYEEPRYSFKKITTQGTYI